MKRPNLNKTDQALLYHQRIMGLFWIIAKDEEIEQLNYTLGYYIYWKFSEALREQSTVDVENFIASDGGSLYIKDIITEIKHYYTFPAFKELPELHYHYCDDVEKEVQKLEDEKFLQSL